VKKIFSAPEVELVHVIKAVLEDEGIPCLVHGEHLYGTTWVTPVVFWPELWVVDDDDFQRAIACIRTLKEATPGDSGPPAGDA